MGSTDLRGTAAAIRRHVIEQSRRADVGHIGSCLSIADILAALYGAVLDIGGPDEPERDRFILSKGHAALALYAALHATGRLPREQLDTYCADGSALGGHPEHALGGVELSTGSLGHGLSVAAGSALAARLARSQRRSVVLLSDAEQNEGSVWEAAMFAAHHELSGLVAIVDCNGQQALGYTRDVIDLEPLAERWRAFGWEVAELDGHDPELIASTISGLDRSGRRPNLILARTVFGHGVSFMESKIAWHYQPLSDDEYRIALEELAAWEDRVAQGAPW